METPDPFATQTAAIRAQLESALQPQALASSLAEPQTALDKLERQLSDLAHQCKPIDEAALRRELDELGQRMTDLEQTLQQIAKLGGIAQLQAQTQALKDEQTRLPALEYQAIMEQETRVVQALIDKRQLAQDGFESQQKRLLHLDQEEQTLQAQAKQCTEELKKWEERATLHSLRQDCLNVAHDIRAQEKMLRPKLPETQA